jgi:hypothetical protein
MTLTQSCIKAIYDILQSLRSEGKLEFGKDIACWIDQISIDQSNEDEKAVRGCDDEMCCVEA